MILLFIFPFSLAWVLGIIVWLNYNWLLTAIADIIIVLVATTNRMSIHHINVICYAQMTPQ